MKTTWFPGRLVALNEAECRDLLAHHQIGRVAWNDPLGPIVVPVNYVLDADGDIRFRTDPNSALAYQVDTSTLAFQIDEADEFLESGWSVLVRGVGRLDPAPSQLGVDDPEPWAAGPRDLHIRLTPQVISGRRIIPT